MVTPEGTLIVLSLSSDCMVCMLERVGVEMIGVRVGTIK